jgi:hypothetical protein
MSFLFARLLILRSAGEAFFKELSCVQLVFFTVQKGP